MDYLSLSPLGCVFCTELLPRDLYTSFTNKFVQMEWEPNAISLNLTEVKLNLHITNGLFVPVAAWMRVLHGTSTPGLIHEFYKQIRANGMGAQRNYFS